MALEALLASLAHDAEGEAEAVLSEARSEAARIGGGAHAGGGAV